VRARRLLAVVGRLSARVMDEVNESMSKSRGVDVDGQSVAREKDLIEGDASCCSHGCRATWYRPLPLPCWSTQSLLVQDKREGVESDPLT